eukprot:122675_1
MSFQNQLTEIQDAIEDAENDIESNIGVTFIKYNEELKISKQKIKSLKKDKKDREKQEIKNKQIEQQQLIEKQKLEIQQLSKMQNKLQLQLAANKFNPNPQSSINESSEEDDDDINRSYMSLGHGANNNNNNQTLQRFHTVSNLEILNNRKKFKKKSPKNRQKSIASQQQFYPSQ